MKNLNDSYHSYYNSFFSHIYVEKSVINHPRTKQLMEKFPEAEIIEIDHYKDVFCRSRQYTAGQHRAQQLILAAKKNNFIYEGAPNWNATDASVTLKQIGNPDIEIHLGNTSSRERFCVIATLENDSGQLKVTRKEQYLKGHREIDQAYGFGFRWTAGRK